MTQLPYSRIGIWVLLLAIGTGTAGCERVPRQHGTQQYRIEQFMNTVKLSGGDVSPDERTLLFSSNASGAFNLYSMPIAGGPVKQLTNTTASSFHAVGFFPGGARILLQEDPGNEVYRLQVLHPDGRRQFLLPDSNTRTYPLGWAGSPRQLYFVANTPQRKLDDVYVMDPNTLQTRLVLANDSLLMPWRVSPDGRYIALTRTVSNTRSEIRLYDTQTSTWQTAVAPAGQGKLEVMNFHPDGNRLLYTSDENSEYLRLMEYNLATRTSRLLYHTNWDVWYARYSSTGKYAAMVVNNDAHSELRLLDLATGQTVPTPGLPLGEIKPLGFSKTDRYLLFYLGQAESSTNLHLYDMENGTSRPMTRTMSAEIDPRQLVRPQAVRFRSFDSLLVPALLYVPRNRKPGEQLPAVVSVHGGPNGQARVGYQPLIQYLVNHGYVVLEVNYRGSAGYGRTFAQLDDRQHGYGNLRDIVQSKQYLRSLGYVDTARVGVMGGSYGGYLTLSALAFHPEAFACGVDLFGVVNWPKLLRSMPSWWSSYRQSLYSEIGDPVRDSVLLAARSPLVHAGNIRRPLLVFQGANDPRIARADVEQLVGDLRGRGVPVEYLLFQDEGHGIRKRSNEIIAYGSILRFLDQHLQPQRLAGSNDVAVEPSLAERSKLAQEQQQ